MKTQVINDFLGNLTIVNYIVAFIFVFIALILKWLWQTIDSVKNNENTPEKFSWGFWFKHNLGPKILSLIATIFSVFLILRFSVEMVNIQFSYFMALSVGLTLDYWINKIKKIQPETIIK